MSNAAFKSADQISSFCGMIPVRIEQLQIFYYNYPSSKAPDTKARINEEIWRNERLSEAYNDQKIDGPSEYR
jgi:hypothetical protein